MSTSNIPPAFSNIIAIADETEQAEAQLKREAHRLFLSREHDLLAQLLDRWCDGAPVEVLAWLKQQPGVQEDRAAHV
ncbi:MAG: hypothetical protein AMXMBFR58_24420 [Phycisphaerae bacterium]